MKLPSMRLATESPDISMPWVKRLITLLSEVAIFSPLEALTRLAPLSSTFKAALLPTARVLGEAPGWV